MVFVPYGIKPQWQRFLPKWSCTGLKQSPICQLHLPCQCFLISGKFQVWVIHLKTDQHTVAVLSKFLFYVCLTNKLRYLIHWLKGIQNCVEIDQWCYNQLKEFKSLPATSFLLFFTIIIDNLLWKISPGYFSRHMYASYKLKESRLML